jgi:hypothetical protein
MNKKEILERLKNDEDYYGEFGQQFLSNSNISTLLTNPLALKEPMEKSPALLVGGYFHTAILEPEKLFNFKVINTTTRNTNLYREMSAGEMCLLQHEADKTEALVDKIMSNEVCRSLIRNGNVEYEVPGIIELFGNMWKGKADILNHDEKLIIDLKTTSNIQEFKWSAKKYNYNSQAYIYSKMFGYEMIFLVIDKNSQQIGIFDCSPEFYNKGEDKVKQASETFTGLQDATGVVTHNCSNGQVFLHTSPDADWTANLTNLSLSTGYGTTVTLIVEQGGTAYVPNALQIAGASQTITWQGSASAPTGNTNKTDIVSFTILNNSGTYKVYGQLTSFG